MKIQIQLGKNNLISTFHELLRDFETKINTDANFINSELEKAGTINYNK